MLNLLTQYFNEIHITWGGCSIVYIYWVSWCTQCALQASYKLYTLVVCIQASYKLYTVHHTWSVHTCTLVCTLVFTSYIVQDVHSPYVCTCQLHIEECVYTGYTSTGGRIAVCFHKWDKFNFCILLVFISVNNCFLTEAIKVGGWGFTWASYTHTEILPCVCYIECVCVI